MLSNNFYNLNKYFKKIKTYFAKLTYTHTFAVLKILAGEMGEWLKPPVC